jgi:hypothetical protein
MQAIESPSLRLGHNPQIRGHRREQAFSSLKHERFFIQRIEGLHVILKRILQLTNKSSMGGGPFKYKETKTLGCCTY